MKKLAYFALALSLFIVTTLLIWQVAKNSGDSVIRQKLIGAWGSGNPAIKGTVTFRPDGSFVVDETFGLGTNAHPVQYDGTWQVEDGYLTTTPTPGNAHVVGSRAKVIRINAQDLVYTENGHTTTRIRSQ